MCIFVSVCDMDEHICMMYVTVCVCETVCTALWNVDVSCVESSKMCPTGLTSLLVYVCVVKVHSSQERETESGGGRLPPGICLSLPHTHI